jgi:hypothetical protein
MNAQLIAPCGMNCGICLAYLRDKNTCGGCWADEAEKRASCTKCSIRNCEALEKTQSKFCYECPIFPCKRLKQLDKRYRLRYAMSMTENLETIKREGLERFVLAEAERWKCQACGGTICVHRGVCLKCEKEKTTKQRTEVNRKETYLNP